MDREKVINGLEQFRADLKPFCGNHADWERFDAALTLLKEQEAAQPNDVRKSSSCAYSSQLIGYCKKCGTKINSIDNRSACGKCGQAVKWDE